MMWIGSAFCWERVLTFKNFVNRVLHALNVKAKGRIFNLFFRRQGVIHEDRLRELLTTMGDRFTDEEVDDMYREAPIKGGLFDYVEFTRYKGLLR